MQNHSMWLFIQILQNKLKALLSLLEKMSLFAANQIEEILSRRSINLSEWLIA